MLNQTLCHIIKQLLNPHILLRWHNLKLQPKLLRLLFPQPNRLTPVQLHQGHKISLIAHQKSTLFRYLLFIRLIQIIIRFLNALPVTQIVHTETCITVLEVCARECSEFLLACRVPDLEGIGLVIYSCRVGVIVDADGCLVTGGELGGHQAAEDGAFTDWLHADDYYFESSEAYLLACIIHGSGYIIYKYKRS